MKYFRKGFKMKRKGWLLSCAALYALCNATPSLAICDYNGFYAGFNIGLSNSMATIQSDANVAFHDAIHRNQHRFTFTKQNKAVTNRPQVGINFGYSFVTQDSFFLAGEAGFSIAFRNGLHFNSSETHQDIRNVVLTPPEFKTRLSQFVEAKTRNWELTLDLLPGYLACDTLLLYGRIGVGFNRLSMTSGTTLDYRDSHAIFNNSTSFPLSNTRSHKVLRLGLGLAHYFSENWVIKADYIFVSYSQLRHDNSNRLVNTSPIFHNQPFAVSARGKMYRQSFLIGIGSRESNDDYFGVKKIEDDYFFIVTDGCGGHKGAKIASISLCQGVLSALDVSSPQLKEAHTQEEKEKVILGVLQSAQKSMSKVLEANRKFNACTTLVFAWLSEKQSIFAHVGDSRIYLLSKKAVLWHSKDHSAVQPLIDSGSISEEEAKHHPLENLLTKAVGMGKEITPSIKSFPALKVGEGVLLASDGFWREVDNETILAILNADTIKTAVLETVNEIVRREPFSDNVTALFVKRTL